MNKAELIHAMTDKSGMERKDIEKALNSFLACVTDTLKAGEKVQLVGFGTFEPKRKNARPGRNPKKPEIEIMIPERTTPVFRAGKQLKATLNED